MNTCFECGTAEGQYHESGCECEVCPVCEGSLCMCGFDNCNRLVDALFHNGEPVERIPYIHYSDWMCVRCGTTDMEIFMVSDAVWKHYVDPQHRDKVICRPCFGTICKITDAGPRKRPDWCGFPWKSGIHDWICTLQKGHGGRRHQDSDRYWFRTNGRIYVDREKTP